MASKSVSRKLRGTFAEDTAASLKQRKYNGHISEARAALAAMLLVDEHKSGQKPAMTRYKARPQRTTSRS